MTAPAARCLFFSLSISFQTCGRSGVNGRENTGFSRKLRLSPAAQRCKRRARYDVSRLSKVGFVLCFVFFHRARPLHLQARMKHRNVKMCVKWKLEVFPLGSVLFGRLSRSKVAGLRLKRSCGTVHMPPFIFFCLFFFCPAQPLGNAQSFSTHRQL